jgi:hypothetical protein
MPALWQLSRSLRSSVLSPAAWFALWQLAGTMMLSLRHATMRLPLSSPVWAAAAYARMLVCSHACLNAMLCAGHRAKWGG